MVVGLCCVGLARVGEVLTCLPVHGQAVVDGLLSLEEDCSLLLSQFCQYLEQDDVRYHAMQAAADTVARVTNAHPEVSWRAGVPQLGEGRAGMGSPGAQARPPAGAPHFLE